MISSRLPCLALFSSPPRPKQRHLFGVARTGSSFMLCSLVICSLSSRSSSGCWWAMRGETLLAHRLAQSIRRKVRPRLDRIRAILDQIRAFAQSWGDFDHIRGGIDRTRSGFDQSRSGMVEIRDCAGSVWGGIQLLWGAISMVRLGQNRCRCGLVLRSIDQIWGSIGPLWVELHHVRGAGGDQVWDGLGHFGMVSVKFPVYSNMLVANQTRVRAKAGS